MSLLRRFRIIVFEQYVNKASPRLQSVHRPLELVYILSNIQQNFRTERVNYRQTQTDAVTAKEKKPARRTGRCVLDVGVVGLNPTPA